MPKTKKVKSKIAAKKRKKKQQEKKFHEALIDQLLTLVTTGFGLVSALAWNDTIKQIVEEFITPRIPGSGLFSRLIYSLLVTFLAVLVTYQLSRIASRFPQSKSKRP